MVRRIAALALSVAQILALIVLQSVATMQPALAATVCATPGKDNSPGTLSGVYNTYYQPPVGTLSAGSTSVPLGTIDTTGGGAATAVAAGDLLLIIQMQDGTFDSTNGASYGDGSSGSGLTSDGNAGLYEYVAVNSVAGGTASITSTGSGGGLLNTYTESAAGGGSGQKTYQIVRVPQYLTATLGGNFIAAYWDGATGGIAAIDMASTLNLGGATLYATGDGFRGAGLSVATTSPTAELNSDYAASVTMNGAGAPADGGKGEGILGTPAYLFGYTNFGTPSTPAGPAVISSTTADGYPGGDMARGAPGDAGGGGTDEDMVANDQNTGGGGGANGGPGGVGGYGWTPSYTGSTAQYSQYGVHTAPGTGYVSTNFHDIGGRGGSALTPSATRIFMGGGGGGGSNNNASNNNSYNAYGSSGGVGGGIVMMRLANTSGSAATIYADGTTGLAPDNDGGGGGGAGGTVIITSPSSFTGITVHADGAAGTTAGDTQTTIGYQHGPGGGGGGGTVITSSSVTATTNGGAAGYTVENPADNYGATAGTGGAVDTVSASSIPGVSSGAECYSSPATTLTGPVDTTDATYLGADYTGTFDGSVGVTNNNDFTARTIPLPGATPLNSGTVPGTWIGNTLSLSSAPTVDVPNSVYENTAARRQVTLTATAPTSPSGWTVQLCPDNAANADGIYTGTPTTPNCAYTPLSATCTNKTFAYFYGTTPTAGSTSTMTLCIRSNADGNKTVYWAVYTAPQNGLVAFDRYDGSIEAIDNAGTPNSNVTHNELYAAYIPVTKSANVVSTGCPSGATPTLPTSDPTGQKVCPGGVIAYTLDYRNVMEGAGQGTEGALGSAFLVTQAGQLAITDNGGSGANNWATTSHGLTVALGAGGTYSTCGVGAGACGASQSGTTCTYSGSGSGIPIGTAFTCTIGGGSFQLYPPGFAGQSSQGTIVFAITIK